MARAYQPAIHFGTSGDKHAGPGYGYASIGLCLPAVDQASAAHAARPCARSGDRLPRPAPADLCETLGERIARLANGLSQLGTLHRSTAARMDWHRHPYLKCSFRIPTTVPSLRPVTFS